MKIGIVTVAHQSERLRPNGLSLVTNFVESLRTLKYEYECVVVDNASTQPLSIPDVHVIRVDDQLPYGLTGAWELGLRYVISKHCDIIIINNDDIIYNETVNDFIKQIILHEHNSKSVYGPVSDGILGGVQLQSTPINSILELTDNVSNMLNGFMFAFTYDFYFKYCKLNGDMFDKHNYPWGGNEEEFQRRVWSAGAKSFVIGQCWVSHKKIRGWKQFKK